MAPRKTEQNIKPPVKRARKPKSLPLHNNSSKTDPDLMSPVSPTSGCNGTPQKSPKKPFSLQRKIELANEVALAQLYNYPLEDELPPTPIVENSAQKPGKGKRKLPTTVKATTKKIKKEYLNSEDDSTSVAKTDSDDAFELGPTLKIGKKKLTYKLIDCNGAGKGKITDLNLPKPVSTAVTPDLLKQPRKRGRRKAELNSSLSSINTDKKEVKLSLTRKSPKKPQESLEVQEKPVAKSKKSTSKSQKIITSTPKTPAKARNQNETKKVPTPKTQNSVVVKKQTNVTVKKRKSSTAKTTKTDIKPTNTVKSSPANKRKPASPKKTESSQLSPTITRSRKKGPTVVRSTTPSGKETEMETSPSDSKQAFVNNDPKAELIGSRKASIDSNNSAFSWVQDISTSSNMTPRVTPTIKAQLDDFVCFDNKMPVVQMVNIDDRSDLIKKQERITPTNNEEGKEIMKELEDSDSESSSSSQSTSSSSSSSSSSDNSNIGIRSPRLTTSSVSYGFETVDTNENKITLALERLAISFQKFDCDMMEWMRNESTHEPTDRLSELGYDALNCERDVISHCRELYRLCREPSPPKEDVPDPSALRRSLEDRTQDEKNTSYEHDDDDALSLFAESITGIETSKLSSVTVPTPVETPVQEYVPVPIANKNDRYSYRPTNIASLNPSPVCEKQSADSTSRADPFLVPPPPIPVTVVFRSTCFHNLVGRCPFQHCLFRHTIPTNEDIARTLSQLDINVLKKEHALLRKYPALKRYESVFDAEIKRRGNHVNINETLEEPLEIALQHLNSAGDNFGPALAKRYGNVWLCDAMLKALADTQNFSRFKDAFVKLALFVSENERSVSVDVATKILERVCILPAEVPIARAMLHIFKLTSPIIYNNNMMSQFEQKLAGLDKSLYEEYLEAKPHIMVKPNCSPLEREKRYTSPDTTHLDNMNNQPPLPLLTRTVDFNLSRTVTNYNVNGSRQNGPYNASTWHRGSFRPRLSARRPARRPMYRPMGTRPYMRPPMNQRYDTFGYQHKYLPRPRTDF